MHILVIDDQMALPIKSELDKKFSFHVSSGDWKTWSSDPVKLQAIESRFHVQTSTGGKDKVAISLVRTTILERGYEAMKFMDGDYVDCPPCPEIAAIDIDFPVEFEDEKGFSGIHISKPRSGRRSARLGWPIAARFKSFCQQLKIDPEIILYSGKGKVIDGLREAIRPVYWEGTRIEPFLSMHSKIEDLMNEGPANSILRSVRRVGLRHFADCAEPGLVAEFTALVGKQKQEWLAEGPLNVLHKYAVIAECFPKEMVTVLGGGSLAADAAASILEACGGVDYHLELLRSFKKMQRSSQDFFATPLAAACHGWAWTYPSNGEVCGIGKVSSVSLNSLSAEERVTQNACLVHWLRNSSALHQDTKRSILKASSLLVWAHSYSICGPERLLWQNSFAKILPRLREGLQDTLRDKVSLASDLSNKDLLTDWQLLFLDDQSVFRDFISYSFKQGAQSIAIRTVEHSVETELVLDVTREDGKHVGSFEGFKGESVDKRLELWGRSWYEWSLPPVDTKSETATVVRYWVWPVPGMIEPLPPTPVSKPVLTLHWCVPNYLRNREARQ